MVRGFLRRPVFQLETVEWPIKGDAMFGSGSFGGCAGIRAVAALEGLR